MKIKARLLISLAVVMTVGGVSSAQVPSVISYQGRVQVGGNNFSGAGQFKFAIVSPGTNVSRLATATAIVTSGFITSATVTDGGAGYTSAPAVTVTDSTGSGAVLTANVSAGAVTSITVNNPGAGYSASPAVSIAAPPPTFVYGTFWSNDGSSSAGSEPAAAVSVPVQAGLITVFLGDTNLANMQPVPPGVFTQADVRLRIWFNDGANGFVQLTPDQRLGAVGYANMAAQVAAGTITASALADNAVTTAKLASNAVTSVQIQDGTIVAADLSTGLLNNTFWKLGGNGGTLGGSNFLGTTDNQPLELKINGTRALRLEPNVYGAPNLIGGAPVNFVAPGVAGAFIGGGGATNYSSSGGIKHTNSIASDFGVIVGGMDHVIETNAAYSVVGGGNANWIQSGSGESAIVGGTGNFITNSGASQIGGGSYNGIAGGSEIAIGSGFANRTISQREAFIGSGAVNQIGGSSRSGSGITFANFDNTIVGGVANWITDGSQGGFIGGGVSNVINGSGWAAVPGGRDNQAAGDYAFAAGHRAKANHAGAFVWADSQAADFASTANDQFLIRAAGGVGINTGGALLSIVNDGGVVPALIMTGGVVPGVLRLRNALEIWPNPAGTTAARIDVRNASGTANITLTGANGNITCVSLTQTSDRNAKEDFRSVDPAIVLGKVAALPLSKWRFKGDPQAQHLGPMAQDFHAAFGLGADNTHIAPLDAGGVALAAIQGLNQKLEEQLRQRDDEIRELQRKLAEFSDLKQTVHELQQLVNNGCLSSVVSDPR